MKLRNLIDTIPETLFWWGCWIFVTVVLTGLFEGWSPFDAAWWGTVTAATVGYGDLFPKTVGGRACAMALIIGSWFFDRLLGAQLAAKLIVNSDAFTHDEQESIKTGLQDILAELKRSRA